MALAFSAAYAQAEGGGAVCAAGHDSFTESGRRLVTAASGVVDFPLLTQVCLWLQKQQMPSRGTVHRRRE